MWSSSASAPASGNCRKSRNGRFAVRQRLAIPELFVLLGDQLAVLLQPLDVLGHWRKRWRLDARRRQSLDRVDVVVRRQLARSLLLEVKWRALVAEVLLGQRVIAVVARIVLREGRVRCIQDALLELDVVDRLGDVRTRRIGRQFSPLLVVVARSGDRLGRARHNLVRPLQVVKAIERLEDRVGVWRFVERVRRGRIKVLRRSLLECGEEGVGPLFAAAVRVVGDVIAAGEQRRDGECACGHPPAHRSHFRPPRLKRCQTLTGAAKRRAL